MKKHLYLALLLALATFSAPAMAQTDKDAAGADQGGAAAGSDKGAQDPGGDICAMAKPEETEVAVLDDDSFDAAVQAAGDDPAAQMDAGMNAYIQATSDFTKAIDDGVASATDFQTQFGSKFKMPADAADALKDLQSRYGAREDASCPEKKDTEGYRTCKLKKLKQEFPSPDIAGLKAKNKDHQDKLAADNSELSSAIQSISAAAMANCGGGAGGDKAAAAGGDQGAAAGGDKGAATGGDKGAAAGGDQGAAAGGDQGAAAGDKGAAAGGDQGGAAAGGDTKQQ